jgi:predicted dehydrogenase
MTSSTLAVGIVGTGGMGTNHATNIADAGHDIVAGADVIEQSREAFATEFDATPYAEFTEMYEEESLDAVVVTTPNKFHEPATRGALERDIDVLCEKPLAHDLASAESVAAAADESDAFCMVGFHNRFTGSVAMFDEYRSRGRIGDVQHVEVNYLRRRGMPSPSSWFTDAELAGGGALLDIGVHALDLALYLAGYPAVESVLGATRSNAGDIESYVDPDGWFSVGHSSDEAATVEVEDSASAFLTCGDGTTISLDVSWVANREPSKAVHVRGSEAGAQLTVGGEDLTLLGVGTGGIDHYSDDQLTGTMDPSGHEAEDHLFLDHVAAGTAPDTNTVEEGLAVQRAIDAIYRSAETGGAVEL